MSRKKLSKIRRADPFFERELARYEFPLPSREYVSQVLADEGRPLEFAELIELLDIASSEREMFQRRLGAMEREGQLLRNRKGAYILPERASLTPGRIQGHPDGYGFLSPMTAVPTSFSTSIRWARCCMATGRWSGSPASTARGGRKAASSRSPSGSIRGRRPGFRRAWRGVRGAGEQAHCPGYPGAAGEEGEDKPQSGQVVMVEIIEQPSKFSQPIGKIIEVLGNYADPGMEIEIALRKHDLPFEFSRAALDENKALPDKVKKADFAGREDLRELPLVTIDGETARDFDDAVFCEKKGVAGGWWWRLPTSRITSSRAWRSTRRRWSAATRCISRAG
jgi:ribonuclease R